MCIALCTVFILHKSFQYHPIKLYKLEAGISGTMTELPILLIQEKKTVSTLYPVVVIVYIISIYFNYLQSIKSHSTNSTPILHIDESINRLRNDNFLVYTLSDVYPDNSYSISMYVTIRDFTIQNMYIQIRIRL